MILTCKYCGSERPKDQMISRSFRVPTNGGRVYYGDFCRDRRCLSNYQMKIAVAHRKDGEDDEK